MKHILPLLALPLFAAQVAADTIEFVNGDRLQGEIVSLQAGKMKFKAAMVGEIEIPMDQIRNFSTDAPVELHLTDGTVLQQQVTGSGQAGEVRVGAGQLVSAQNIALGDIGMINPPEVVISWDGRISAGVAMSTGNTESQNAYVDGDMRRRTEQDRIIIDVEYIENREENVNTGVRNTSRRRYALGGHYDYFIRDGYYVYGNVDTEKEATANLDLRLTIGSGGGYSWIHTPTTSLDSELGLSWVNESYSDATPDNDYIAARIAWRYDHRFNGQLRFFHSGQWLPSLEDADDQLVKTETGLRSDLSRSLFLEAKVVYDWDATPAIDKDKEDITYNLGVGWSF